MSAGREITTVTLPVSRVKALTRTVAWGAPTAVGALLCLGVYGRLSLAAFGVSGRLVEYSLVVCMIPMALAEGAFAFLTLRWLLLALWPGTLGIFGDDEGMLLRLGSFGTRRYESARLDIKYPFEQEQDTEGSSVEAFLPEEQQRATLLPSMVHPDATEPINHTILRFVSMMEPDAAAEIRPWVDRWQARHTAPGQPAGELQD